MKKYHNRVITGYEGDVFKYSYANIFAQTIALALREEGIEANLICAQDKYRFNGINRPYPTHYGILLSNGKVFDCLQHFRSKDDFLAQSKADFQIFNELNLSNANGLYKDVYIKDPIKFVEWALESGFAFSDSKEALIESIPKYVEFVKKELLKFDNIPELEEEELEEVLEEELEEKVVVNQSEEN